MLKITFACKCGHSWTTQVLNNKEKKAFKKSVLNDHAVECPLNKNQKESDNEKKGKSIAGRKSDR